jgi:hypothetical protein
MPAIDLKRITLVGLSLTNLSDDAAVQLALPLDPRHPGEPLDTAVDDVRDRYGAAAITRARLVALVPAATLHDAVGQRADQRRDHDDHDQRRAARADDPVDPDLVEVDHREDHHDRGEHDERNLPRLVAPAAGRLLRAAGPIGTVRAHGGDYRRELPRAPRRDA